jgi:hypothetical protein
MRPMIPKRWGRDGFCRCELHECSMADAREHFRDWLRYLDRRWWESCQRGSASRRSASAPVGHHLNLLAAAIDKHFAKKKFLSFTAERLSTCLGRGTRTRKGRRSAEVATVDEAMALAEIAGADVSDGDLLEEVKEFRERALKNDGFDCQDWWGPHVSEHADKEATVHVTVTSHAHFLLAHEGYIATLGQTATTNKHHFFVVPDGAVHKKSEATVASEPADSGADLPPPVRNLLKGHRATGLAERIRHALLEIEEEVLASGKRPTWRWSVIKLPAPQWEGLAGGWREVDVYHYENEWLGIRSSHPDGPGADKVLRPTELRGFLERLRNVGQLAKVVGSRLTL